MQPLISVLIPAYNCEKYIREAVESVINQTYKNIEIIICNDCSTDETFDILLNVEKQDSRIKIISNEINLGYLRTFNKLLRCANGQYISFLDADDFLSSDKIDLQRKAFEGNPNLGLVGCNYAAISTDGNLVRKSSFPLSYTEINSEMCNTLCFCGSSVMIKREVFEKIGGYREYFIGCVAEDYDWIWRIIEHYEACNIPQIGYYYRFHNESLTRKVYFSIKKRHIHDIVKYLAKTRETIGTDFIMTQSIEEEQNLISRLREPYDKDKGLLYRKIVIEYSINKNSKKAKMYFSRLLKLSGLNFSVIKTWIIMKLLLIIDYNTLLWLKKISGIKHLANYA